MSDITKHTPGPWHFLEAHSHDDGYSSTHHLTICSDDADDLAEIYSSADSTTSIPREQAIANAHLIAAATDILSALKALQLQALQSSVNSPANEWGMEALGMTSAAIAKAEGRGNG